MTDLKYPTPFIKKFKTSKNNYIYDVNSNEIIRVDSILYDIIDEIGKSGKNENDIINKFRHLYPPASILEKYEAVLNAQSNNNYFSSHTPVIFSGIKCEKDIKNILEGNLNQVILELTERCSNRCKYCAYSGKYRYNRPHGQSDMSLETAIKAVEYFMGKSRGNKDENPPAITFYGGEPLLCFNLIKEVVESIRKKGAFETYRFSLTTNGILLNDEIVEYFSKNNISIWISLDGPKKIHDRYRVFKDGAGTFDVIVNHLKRIKRLNPGYFNNNISFNAVLTPPYDFDAIIDFFFHRKRFESLKKKVKIQTVDAYDTSFFKDFELEKDHAAISKELARLRNRYKNALIKGVLEKLTIEEEFFFKPLHTIACRPMEQLDATHPPSGTCWPGQRRLFVDTHGDFYMCERVGSNYRIGDVDQGFDYKEILEFFIHYDLFFKDCQECWAVRLCKKCFNDIRRGSELDKERKEKFCINMLKSIESNLILYCEILEQNKDAFYYFKDVSLI